MSDPRVVLVRHGETEWSRAGRHTGNTDVPLTDEGRRQAELLGERLAGTRFALVLTSPLVRAADTCRLAGLGADAEVRKDLAEWDYGRYEGLTTSEVCTANPGWCLWRDGCPGGESPADVGRRAERVTAELESLEGDAAIFAHGHLLRVLAARWLRMEVAAGRSFVLSTGSVCLLGREREAPVIWLWNDAEARL